MGVARRWLVVWSQVVGVCWSQADYASHSTTTTADFQGCGGSACADCSPTCTHAAAGSRCTKQSDAWWMCWPPGGVSAYGTYNLQLYGWAIESRFFSDAMCRRARRKSSSKAEQDESMHGSKTERANTDSTAIRRPYINHKTA